MRPLSTIVSNVQATLVPLTGAAPITGNGPTFDTRQAARGSLAVYVSANIKASGLTYTGQWQVSMDGSTWANLNGSNGAAEVQFGPTGTGSDVAFLQSLDAPSGVYGFRYCRFNVTTGGSATGVVGHDNVTIGYSYTKSQLGS